MRLKLSRFQFLELNFFNFHWNKKIESKSDIEIYGVKERWSINEREGDCDDYSLTKMYHLFKKSARYDNRNICLAVGYTERKKDGIAGGGEAHAFLIVRTHHGDYIMDNRFSGIFPIEKPRYKINKIKIGERWFKCGFYVSNHFSHTTSKFVKMWRFVSYIIKISILGVPEAYFLEIRNETYAPYGWNKFVERTGNKHGL